MVMPTAAAVEDGVGRGADMPWAPESFPLNAQPKCLGEKKRTFLVIARDNQGSDPTVLRRCPSCLLWSLVSESSIPQPSLLPTLLSDSSPFGGIMHLTALESGGKALVYNTEASC